MFGIADENDVAELQRLMRLHPEIVSAVEACEKWLEDFAQRQAVAVPDSTRVNLLNAVDREIGRPAPGVGSPRSLPGRFYIYMVAASLLLAIVCAGFAYYFYRQTMSDKAAYALLSDPEVIKVTLQGVDGKESSRATLYWNPKTRDVYLQPNLLPKAPADKQYQVWALVDGKPIDAGLLQSENGLSHMKPIEKAQAFAITLEKAGGSPTPTMNQLYVMGKVNS